MTKPQVQPHSRRLKVEREYYRIGPRGREYESPGEAVRAAFIAAAEGNMRSISVERVTVHEPYDGPIGPITETVTGEISIPGPALLARASALARYHPVNGWEVPEEIEIDIDA